MILYAVLPELLIILLCCVIRTVAAKDIIPMLIILSIVKALYCRKHPYSFRRNPQLPVVCLMIEFAAVTSLYAGYANAGTILKNALIAAATMIVGYMAVPQLNRMHSKFPFAVVYVLLAAVSVIGFFVFRLCADYETTLTYNWVDLGPITLQYSELLKLPSVIAFASACSNRRKHPMAFLFYYGYQVFNVLLLALLQEFGTAMEFIFATCVCAMLVLPFPKRMKPIRQHLAYSTLPATTLAVLCILLRLGKQVLMQADVSASKTNVLGHTVHFWNIRLNSTGEETRKAAECMRNSPLMTVNLTGFQSFRSMKPSVMTDYVFTLMVENFGWLIPSLLMALFAAVMIHIAVKRRRKAAEGGFLDAMALATAALLLIQAAIHILGPLRMLPFSGITLPFLSNGLNSMIVCLLLLTATEDTTAVPMAAPETGAEVLCLKQAVLSDAGNDLMLVSDDD
ncbi:MAG: FtsW/RodA/SpoVE family cell cycle protein [Oscillospiraceae bacterium]|nr:FtsW/RodA/SpoVE family cell cycle protein [Oscillospiraceae bacterium]